MEELQEEALIKAIVNGDTQQFEELVDAYKDKIFNMACRFTENIQEGQDLAQEIFILIYKNLKSFQGKSSLSTWIYRVSLNRCLDWQRKNRRRKLMLFQYKPPDQKNQDWDILKHIPSPHATPEEIALQREETRLLHQAIQQLPEKYQQVIILYHFQNLTYQEIGEILDLPIRTVETRLYRGKQRLKDMMQNMMEKGLEVKSYGYIQPE